MITAILDTSSLTAQQRNEPHRLQTPPLSQMTRKELWDHFVDVTGEDAPSYWTKSQLIRHLNYLNNRN